MEIDNKRKQDEKKDSMDKSCCGKDNKDMTSLEEEPCGGKACGEESCEGSSCGAEENSDNIKTLEAELSKVKKERDDYLSMAQRSKAEFDNFRKRNRSAVAQAYEEAKVDTVKQILPILDNLQRALEASQENESAQTQAICKGVEMVTKQFIDILAKMGVEEIDALGQPFDPTYHDAVMQVEAENEEQKNTVVEVVLKGYKTEDKVIRYSMVKVAN